MARSAGKRALRAGGFAVVVCLWALAAPAAVLAQGDLQGRFMQTCRDGFAKNNPVWSEERTGQICACRTRFLWAKETQSDVRLLVEAREAGEEIRIPDHLSKSDVQFIQICTRDFAARPEDYQDKHHPPQ